MAASTNIYGFNIGGNNNSFDQRGHFYRAFLSGNVSGMLVKQNSTPNMTVLVEHGSALLDKNTISASIAEIKSDTSVTIDTANTSNPRIDTVVIYEDTSVAIPAVENDYWQDGAGGRFKIVSLPGTAGAVPVALSDANIQTAIGAGKPWTRLANITVPANSSTIVNSNINNGVRSKLGVPLNSVNGGTTAGVLTTDASGVVSVKGNYSTSEVSTNTTWVDGKTVYKKTINFGSLPNNTTKDVNHNITGLSQLIEVTGTATYSSGARFPLPFVASSLGAQIQIIVTDTAISITTGSDRSGATAYVTLLYTKS